MKDVVKWDMRFLEMAQMVASWSKDPSTKCGAVIVRPDFTIASVGYNGFPRGCRDDEKIYENRDLKYSRVVHAEVNAVLQAYERVNGYTIYTTFPCDRCATVIIQAGITRVVAYHPAPEFAERWRVPRERAEQMFFESGVLVTLYEPNLIMS